MIGSAVVLAEGGTPFALLRRSWALSEGQGLQLTLFLVLGLFGVIGIGILAEGAGAAGLAAVIAHPERFRGRKVGLVICGGNIDTRLLGLVLQRQLVRERKLVTWRFESADQPGALARIATIIGAVGGNILDVTHHRLFLDISAKATDMDFTVETRDAEHTQQLEDALREAGLKPRRLSSSGS